MKFILSILTPIFLLCAVSSADANSLVKSALSSESCKKLGNFYWEIGDKNGVVLSGKVGSTYSRTTVIPVASATKLIYAAYVAEKRKGIYTVDDKKFLNFQSGYTEFSGCDRFESVGQCASTAIYHPENLGKFYYAEGHMQIHASSIMGLSGMKSSALSREINSTLGTSFTFGQARPDGGANASAATYATFLSKVINNKLHLGSHLGESPVCTSYAVCPDKAVRGGSPAPEPLSYGLGYWIENQPVTGDGSYSSAGALGFYPWISVDKKYYGIISRKSIPPNAGLDSFNCGREIRKAYFKSLSPVR